MNACSVMRGISGAITAAPADFPSRIALISNRIRTLALLHPGYRVNGNAPGLWTAVMEQRPGLIDHGIPASLSRATIFLGCRRGARSENWRITMTGQHVSSKILLSF
jgi:hypothetical protein